MRIGFGPQGSRIAGFGHYQPARVLTNHDVAAIVATSDEWIRTRTGIRERRLAGPDETVAIMAAEAGRMALDDAGIDPADVSLVVVASTTSEARSPNTAGLVAVALGLAGPAVLDVNTACSGFTYAIAVADQAIRAGAARVALVIGADRMSSVTDWTDRTTCILSADGAGAAVLVASEPAAVGPVVWGQTPQLVDAVRITTEAGSFAQEGRQVLRWALTEAAGHARRAVAAAGLETSDIEVFAFHQANLRIVEPLAHALGADGRIVITDVVESGNTSAGSIPLGVSKRWHDSGLPHGVPMLLFGFGGGFTYAGQVVLTP